MECQSIKCGPSAAGAKATNPPPSKPVREWSLPSEEEIRQAATLQVTCEDGTRVSFGSLFAAHRTIAVFIRHFWCPLCQDYMSSLKALVQPEMLSRWSEAPDVRGRLVSFVVISNGAHGMIRKYRRMFGLPFHVYTDPTLELYKVLGMGRDGDDGHRHLASAKEKRGGGYVKRGLMGGIAMVVVRAIKVGMPVWEKGGDIGQLGGEFIFGPGLKCSFAHRMQTTKGHAPIEDVLEAAGIDISTLSGKTNAQGGEEIAPTLCGLPKPMVGRGGRRRHESMRTVRETMVMHRRASAAQKQDDRRLSTVGGLMMSREEEEEWMAERQHHIEMLQERKNIRRGTSSRAASAMSSYARHGAEIDDAQMSPAILEAVGEMSDERAELEDRRESFDSSRDGDKSDDEKTVDPASTPTEDRSTRIRVPSVMETDSCYSTPSGENGRNSIFMDADTGSDSWKEDERNIQPTTSYLFIH
ncbi:hypothetical protein BDN70DRAFT_849873 [Pholiota conissans]|uniref:Thioredoxin-like protein n=1 Tax=Pholiota conissans TaxID=109636 RepID=A0A9P6CYR1_9AGAR|nr:hypothetical protein BDN70DRAFT_849873 [Pholiota conissans]